MFWRFAFQANADSFETLLDKLDNADVSPVASSASSVSSERPGPVTSTAFPWDNQLEAVLKDGELLTELKKGNDRLLLW